MNDTSKNVIKSSDSKEIMLENDKSEYFNERFLEFFNENESLSKEKALISNKNEKNFQTESFFGVMENKGIGRKRNKKDRKLEDFETYCTTRQNPASFSNRQAKILIKKKKLLKNTPNNNSKRNLNKEENFNTNTPIELEFSEIRENCLNFNLEAQISDVQKCIENFEIEISEEWDLFEERFQMLQSRLSEIEKTLPEIEQLPDLNCMDEVKTILLVKPKSIYSEEDSFNYEDEEEELESDKPHEKIKPLESDESLDDNNEPIAKKNKNNDPLVKKNENNEPVEKQDDEPLESLEDLMAVFQNEVLDRMSSLEVKIGVSSELINDLKKNCRIEETTGASMVSDETIRDCFYGFRSIYDQKVNELEKQIFTVMMEKQKCLLYTEQRISSRINMIEKENKRRKLLLEKSDENLKEMKFSTSEAISTNRAKENTTNNLNYGNSINTNSPLEFEFNKIWANLQNITLETQISDIIKSFEKVEIKMLEDWELIDEKLRNFSSNVSNVSKIEQYKGKILKQDSFGSGIKKIKLIKPKVPKISWNIGYNPFYSSSEEFSEEDEFLENLEESISGYQDDTLGRLWLLESQIERSLQSIKKIKSEKECAKNLNSSKSHEIQERMLNFISSLENICELKKLEETIMNNFLENKNWLNNREFGVCLKIDLIEENNNEIKQLIQKSNENFEMFLMEKLLNMNKYKLIQKNISEEEKFVLSFSVNEANEEKANKLQETFMKNEIEICPNEVVLIIEILERHNSIQVDFNELKKIQEKLLANGEEENSQVVEKLVKCFKCHDFN